MSRDRRNMLTASPTSDQITRELAATAIRKRQQGKKPSRDELAALRRLEKSREEDLRWQFSRSIPKKHWRSMSGRQNKQIDEQAARYRIPFSGPTIDLPAVVRALHDFLAKNALRFTQNGNGAELDGLERLRRAKAEMAELDRDRVRGGFVARVDYEQTVDVIARLVVDEIESAAAVQADRIVAVLTAAGIRMNKPQTAVRLIGKAAAEHAGQLRERIADGIRDSGIA